MFGTLNLTVLLLVSFLASPVAPAPDNPRVEKDCTWNGMKLYGRIKFVKNFPDIKIKIVENFPDLKVKVVDNFPDACGKWQIVDDFPNLKVQVVENFPDIKVKFVENFPGLP
jgi:hypothetical protein